MVVMGLGLPEVVMVLAVIVIKVIPYIFFAVLVALVVRYLNARPRRDRERKTAHSLGEVLAEERRRCGMTQEFVAHELGVSRQAVSKWEKGTSDPSMPQGVVDDCGGRGAAGRRAGFQRGGACE